MERIESVDFPYRDDEDKKIFLKIETFSGGRCKSIMNALVSKVMPLATPLIGDFVKELMAAKDKIVENGEKFSFKTFDFESIDYSRFAFEKIISELIQILIDDENDDLLKIILLNTSVQYLADGTVYYFKDAGSGDFDEDAFDQVFSGDLSLMYNCIHHILEANYKDFLFIFSRRIKKKAIKETAKQTVKSIGNLMLPKKTQPKK